MNITIDKTYCKGCEICINACPKGVFAMSDERHSAGTLIPYAKEISKCINCKLCEQMCPDGCINVEKEEA
ncbi:MAG TPA: 4Fe-4S dicluster domain-containing protein [Anaerovoracaceae bacterium]|nr:4Fe-4S dicluster domain-containing protein [Anaerovoracaceae bacterium]